MQDYYSILQIDPFASYEEVRAAYKRLAIITHPDRSEHPRATQRMQLLNEAYEVLSDLEKRAQYDRDWLASTALVIVQQPVYPDQPVAEDRNKQRDQQRRRKGSLRSQLKILWYLTLLTIAFFVWSLASGTISILMILSIVLLVLVTLVSMIMGVRNLER